ncbi:restriction endonuclease [Streptococcus suis]|uniref:HIRAN domain-containing protein n=1 Tax=Streptococcus suis TaxID=1307 RepID=UPI001E5A3671|nr:HIRAN domain-containing protein [Streptococcus suis]MCB2860605.1 restriction endonuclease [Streptococcus suis]MCB2869142.1 restriction endonuclease [Streptococcus suis]
MAKTVEKIIFRVAGVTNYKKAVKQACDDIAEDNGIPDYSKYYGDLSTKEIREELEEFGGQIFKYQDLSTTEIKLIPEPDNRYDGNAIKVLIFDNFVGYVPGRMAKNIRHYFDDNKFNFISEVEIKGGPYKEWDEYEEKVIINNDLDVGFEIFLTIIDSSQNEENQSESSEIINLKTTDEETDVVEPIKAKITEFEHIVPNISSDSFIDIENKNNVSKSSPKKNLSPNKVIFYALYIFLIFFGFVGIPIAPFLAIPLTAWSCYKLYKLIKK